jgi:hypothetical protein
MLTRTSIAAFLCVIGLHAAACASAADSRQAAALWLTQQLHRPVEPAQILIVPEADTLEGCTILHARPAPTGATSFSLRCPAHVLPQLVLLKIPLDAVSETIAAVASAPLSHASATPKIVAPKTPPLVRAGAALQADWRTPALHAELPVVAMDSGAAGAEIRVRIAHGVRILRARILTAHSVAIVEAGA